MLIFKRLLVYLQPLFVISEFSLLFLMPQWFYYLLVTNVLITMLCLWYLIGSKTGLKDFFYFILTPLFIITSGFIFFVFLEIYIIGILIILIISYFIFIFYNKVFFEFYKKPLWQLKSFYHLVLYAQIISLWFFTTAIFGLIIFVNLDLYLALGLVIFFALLSFGQFCWISEISDNQLIKGNLVRLNLSYLVFLILFVEIAFILKLLPLTYYFKGFIFTVTYYLFGQTFFFSSQENQALTKRHKINLYVLFSIFIIIIFINLLIAR